MIAVLYPREMLANMIYNLFIMTNSKLESSCLDFDLEVMKTTAQEKASRKARNRRPSIQMMK
jgi:hypothetical protein